MSDETPYAVICQNCGKQYLTEQQYDLQMSKPDHFWTCPKCYGYAQWDDDNYEKYLNKE